MEVEHAAGLGVLVALDEDVAAVVGESELESEVAVGEIEVTVKEPEITAVPLSAEASAAVVADLELT